MLAKENIKKIYDRRAKFYDFVEFPIERLIFSSWRQRLWSAVNGSVVLEVGVGTGKNFPYYPASARVFAIDFSPEMLKRAIQKVKKFGLNIEVRTMDVEEMDFPDNYFDSVVASFVFCSVPNPIRGLCEVKRVLRGGGRLVLLEHVRSERWFGVFMDLLNPIAVRITGANINRRTVENVVKTGFEIIKEENLFLDLVKLIIARKPYYHGS
jgi:ubiquinone/menaquinone biosynthesis C-methylase UbiE